MWAVVGNAQTGLDRRAFEALATSRGSLLAHFVDALSVAGPPLAALGALALIALLIRRRRWLDGSVIVAGSFVTLLAAHFAKAAQQRPRPPGDLIHAGGFAFPSTDAALSVVLVVIAILAGRLTQDRARQVQLVALGVLLCGLTGVVLVCVRVHYLTDVLAGWGLGAASFAACALAARAFDGFPRARTRS